jgi:hypothetical protein
MVDSRDQGRKYCFPRKLHTISDLFDPQISLERMDEVFGTADFSNVEDVGIAARRAKRIDDEDVEDIQVNNSKS